jgi:hypothetical protein
VHGPSLVNGDFQRKIPHPFLNSKNAAPKFNSIAIKKLPLVPEKYVRLWEYSRKNGAIT